MKMASAPQRCPECNLPFDLCEGHPPAGSDAITRREFAALIDKAIEQYSVGIPGIPVGWILVSALADINDTEQSYMSLVASDGMPFYTKRGLLEWGCDSIRRGGCDCEEDDDQ